MNNCIDFAKSINCDDFANRIRLFFDQIIALYNLVGRFSTIDISTDSDDTSIRFIILSESVDEAIAIYSVLDQRVVNIYKRQFITKITRNDKYLNIELSEVASG